MEHLTEIKALSKDLLKIYIELGKVTLKLARKQEGANQQNLEKINALFYDASPRKKEGRQPSHWRSMNRSFIRAGVPTTG